LVTKKVGQLVASKALGMAVSLGAKWEIPRVVSWGLMLAEMMVELLVKKWAVLKGPMMVAKKVD
jgi:hypothetical protein